MITNAVCTVVRSDESRIVWHGECMWQEVKAHEVKKYGEERADNVTVFIPDISADIREGDMMIKGKYTDCDHVIRNGLTVMSVSRNDFGSPDMQHLELGVR